MSISGVLAYIDPVSGAIVLQLIVAGALGTIAFFRRSIWNVFCFVCRRGRAKEDSQKK